MKQCAAILICTEYSDKKGAGDRCDALCHGDSGFCWTHMMAVRNGMRTRDDVIRGVGVTGEVSE